MKSTFFLPVFFSCLVYANMLLGQSNPEFRFSFEVYVNNVTQGIYSLDLDLGLVHYGHLSSNNNNGILQVCPGDEITLRNFCQYRSDNSDPWSNWHFDGNNHQATLGFTGYAQCSNPNHTDPYFTNIPIHHSTHVNTTTSPPSPSWNQLEPFSITVPNYTETPNSYLIISHGLGNSIPNCHCGVPFCFLPIEIDAIHTSIDNQTICAGEVVNLNLDPTYTYSNWSPNNPENTAPTATTNYTVEISNSNGCSINESFMVIVNNPPSIFTDGELCYGEQLIITEDDFWDFNDNLSDQDEAIHAIAINGVMVIDIFNNVENFPIIIDAATYGVGNINITSTHLSGCTQAQNITIHPEIELNMANNYDFCNSNFQPICATSNGQAQTGINYIWRQDGVYFAVGTGVCFTPTAYGNYTVTAYGPGGCQVSHDFTVQDPGVGIKHPKNIKFCSMTDPNPSYIGWAVNPFSTPYSFAWTYTNTNGITNTINNTGLAYQVPYLGPGTYTAVVNANGCTETFTITVTDLFQMHTNHPYAAISVSPLGGNVVSCQPTSSLQLNDIWIVEDQFGNNIPTTFYQNGIQFSYITGVQYTIKLKRYAPKKCRIYANQFLWADKKRRPSSPSSTKLTPHLQIQLFPNPTSGLVNLNIQNAQQAISTIRVYGILGELLFEQEIKDSNNFPIDLSNEVSGTYHVQIINGDQQLTQTIIKK